MRRVWERRHIIEEPPPAWLAAAVPAGSAIGYDPLLISEDGLQRYPDAGLNMVPVARNPVDVVWHRPAAAAGRPSDTARTGLCRP